VVVVNHEFPYLTVLVFVPAAGALFLGVTTRASRLVVEIVGMTVAFATLAFAITIAVLLHTGTGAYQFVSDHVWAQSLGISWFVGVDGISVFLVLLAAVLFPIALAGARVRENARAFVAWMLLLEAACIGTFISLDLIMFFLFFELTLVPAYFLISGWGYTRRAYAAVKFFIYTFLGSAFLLVGIVAALDSWTKMAGVLLFYTIYVNVENAILTPRIMRSSVNLMGLTILVALLLGTALAGIVGALVAVPTAALISVLLEEYAVQKDVT